jgi:ABC-type microcin C transport system permease subunit YejB
MDKKGISKNVIVLIIVAILVVSVIAVYLVTSGGPSDGTATDITNNGGTTDTTNGETTDSTNDNGTTDTTNNGGTTVDVSGASSLQFKVIVDPTDGDNIDYTYSIKNAGTSSLMMRIEM